MLASCGAGHMDMRPALAAQHEFASIFSGPHNDVARPCAARKCGEGNAARSTGSVAPSQGAGNDGSLDVAQQDPRAALEARLAVRGIAGGLYALVERWRKHVEVRQSSRLSWEHVCDPFHPPRQQAPHAGGIFILDSTAADEWLLTHEWPDWGRRELGYGYERDLKSEALQTMRAGGPFGGAQHAFPRASAQVRCPASHMLRKGTADGELRWGELVPGLQVLLHVRLNGSFSHRVLDADIAEAELGKLAIGLISETLVVGERRVPWTFSECWPLLGTSRTSRLDLLACWLAVDEVAVIAVNPDPVGIFLGTWAEVRVLDVEAWAHGLPQEPLAPATPAPPPGAAPRTGAFVFYAKAQQTRPPAPTPAIEKMEPESGVKPPVALAAALAGYLAVIEGALPARQTGSEFARELVRALASAAIAGARTTTGTSVAVLIALHRQGHLAKMPSDQVGREALKIVADHTPLVRRISYRCWCLAFGDLLDPDSPVRVALRPFEGA